MFVFNRLPTKTLWLERIYINTDIKRKNVLKIGVGGNRPWKIMLLLYDHTDFTSSFQMHNKKTLLVSSSWNKLFELLLN